MTDNIKQIENVLEDNYMPYAMSVIVSRAIPKIDGFKPSHRKILYTMYKMGLLQGAKTKSSNIVGQSMKLHPHGDASIYETMVRLTTGRESLLHPFVESKGTMGKHYSKDMAYAAHRYTEAKLTKISEQIFKNIDMNLVDMQDNYDGTTKEPDILPVRFPNILINPNSGIAVSMASNICSFNMSEVIDFTCSFIKNEKEDPENYIKGPDFSTGGEFIYNKENWREILNKGIGTFYVQGKYKHIKNRIEIYEIPYTTTSEAIIDDVIELVKNKTIKEISDIRDETDKKGLKITIDIKKNTDVKRLMDIIYSKTKLRDSFSCNFNILVNKRPVVLGFKEIISEWIKFRIEVLVREIEYKNSALKEKLHKLRALEKVLLDIDKVIKIIRETEKEKDVIKNLCNFLKIDAIQAEYIADIKLRNLNKEYILKRTSEIKSTEKEIEENEKILKSKVKKENIIIRELKEIDKKYGLERKTSIINERKIEYIEDKDLIEDYNVKVYFSNDGYIKKIPLTSLRAAGEIKYKDSDFEVLNIDASNSFDLILFTDKTDVYKTKLSNIEDSKPSDFGVFAENIFELKDNEKPLFIHATKDYSGHFLVIYNDGKALKIPVKSFFTKTNRKKLSRAIAKGVVNVVFLDKDRFLYTRTNDKREMIINTKIIPEKKTKGSRGVQIFTKRKERKILESYLVDAVNDDILFEKIPRAGKKIEDMQLKLI